LLGPFFMAFALVEVLLIVDSVISIIHLIMIYLRYFSQIISPLLILFSF